MAILFVIFLASPILSLLIRFVSRTFRPIVPMSAVVIVVGVAAFVTGLISIIKGKERSILVFIGTLVGVFALIFVLGEFLFPH